MTAQQKKKVFLMNWIIRVVVFLDFALCFALVASSKNSCLRACSASPRHRPTENSKKFHEFRQFFPPKILNIYVDEKNICEENTWKLRNYPKPFQTKGEGYYVKFYCVKYIKKNQPCFCWNPLSASLTPISKSTICSDKL